MITDFKGFVTRFISGGLPFLVAAGISGLSPISPFSSFNQLIVFSFVGGVVAIISSRNLAHFKDEETISIVTALSLGIVVWICLYLADTFFMANPWMFTVYNGLYFVLLLLLFSGVPFFFLYMQEE